MDWDIILRAKDPSYDRILKSSGSKRQVRQPLRAVLLFYGRGAERKLVT